MSSSSRRPNLPARASQMTAQEDVIAKRRAEIQARAASGSASGAGPSAGSAASGSGSSPSAPYIGKPLAKKGLNLKNRWGFKGKKPEEKKAAEEAPESEVKFSNDGSFLETFKKMQQGKDVKPGDTSVPFLPSAIAAPPPTKQEEDWFNEALKKAREIAKKTRTETGEVSPVASTSAAPAAVVKTERVEEEAEPAEVKREPLPPEVLALELPTVADELASLVAVNGDGVEELARERNLEAKELMFLQDKTCGLYLRYRLRVDELRAGFRDERKRGGQMQVVEGKSPQLVAYALKVFGSVDLEPHQWKQCEDQMKMSLVYQDLMVMQTEQKIREQKAQKRQYEYDSDEEIDDGGTWEHKARRLEMEKTLKDARELTDAGKGKHHIGDFLPPDELTKFLKKYDAVKSGDSFEESDYAESKLTQENKGFKMLQSMGWSEGSGLGANAQGITNPVNQGNQSGDKKGLGVQKPHDLNQEDDEFDAYRKRMMLAYRFRPNPLNNPRRAYY